MFVRTLLDPANASPENWSFGALAYGDEVILRFSGVYNLPLHCQVLLDYRRKAAWFKDPDGNILTVVSESMTTE